VNTRLLGVHESYTVEVHKYKYIWNTLYCKLAFTAFCVEVFLKERSFKMLKWLKVEVEQSFIKVEVERSF